MRSVLDLIGETPLIEVTQFARGPCQLFLKLESANPSGSIKDRPARSMIEAAEADGRLKPGGTIVEATAGNTGLGLALVGGRKGYRTPVKRLYMVGASTWPGAGTGAGAGFMLAKMLAGG